MRDISLGRAVDIMISTDRMHRCLLDSLVRDIGIHHTQHRILMILAKRGALPSQKVLADRLKISPAAVTGALKKLEASGYIERSLGSDNRFMELRITESGREIVDATKKMFSSADRSLFNGFTDEELEAYVSFLEKLQCNIRAQLDERSNENRNSLNNERKHI